MDWLNLSDLVNLAELYPPLRQVIEKYYITGKYHCNLDLIHIQAHGDDFGINVGDSFDEAHQITGFTSVLRFFRLFGSLLSHVEIYHISDPEDNTKFLKIGQYIEEYSRDSLISITLKMEATDLLSHWNRSFSNARDVEFVIDVQPRTNLTDLFPSVNRLNVTAFIEFPYDQLNFPNLTHFKYVDFKASDENTVLMDFIRSSPNLQNVIIEKPIDVHCMRFLSENFPRLESLDVMIMNFDTDPLNSDASNTIHFHGIRHFTFELAAYSSRDVFPLKFYQLESLKFLYNQWTYEVETFIASNKNLRRLSLPRTTLTIDQLSWLIDNLDYLKTIEFQWTGQITVEQLTLFMSRNQSLKCIFVHITAAHLLDAGSLLSATPSKWMVAKTISDSGVILEFRRS